MMELLQPGLQIRPQLTHTQVAHLAEHLYSLGDVHITDLNAYDDKNYHLQVTEECKTQDMWQHGYVMKVMNSLDSKKLEFVDAQNEMMLYLDTNGIICPQPVKNVHGKYYSVLKIYKQGIQGETGPYKEHVVRLLTFQPGQLLLNVPCTGALFYKAGRYIAGLDLLLKGFQHPAYDHHKTLWMMESIPTLKNFTYAVNDPERHALATHIIEKFQEVVLPRVDNMEKGLLHGDFNEQNILVQQSSSSEDSEWYIHSVLDFGDCHISCYVFELAITICYMMLQSKLLHPLDAGGHVIAGYITERPLPPEEFQLLKTCVSARLCQSLVLGAYSHLQDPSNLYVLTTAPTGWDMLHQLWHTPEQELNQRWKAVMASYPNNTILH